jgi:hypothetical protein
MASRESVPTAYDHLTVEMYSLGGYEPDHRAVNSFATRFEFRVLLVDSQVVAMAPASVKSHRSRMHHAGPASPSLTATTSVSFLEGLPVDASPSGV